MAAVQADGQLHLHNERIGAVISRIRVHDRLGRPPLTEGHPARKRTQTTPPVLLHLGRPVAHAQVLPHCCHV